MASPSKEELLLQLLLENSPLKQWHFEDLLKQTKMTRASLNKWLKKYQEEKLLHKFKKKGTFPYYTSRSDNPVYQSKKRKYLFDKIYESGLIRHLLRLDAKTIIIFGSAAKGDWYKGSDIDIFVFGKTKRFEKHKYELVLKRDIELHMFKDKKDIKAVESGLIQNISNGYIVKGSLQDFAKVTA